MGIIAKGYTAVITVSATIQTSDIVAAFDRIYNVVNGGIDGANFAAIFSTSASNVTITDSNSFISGTRASDIATELTMKGWNSIHTIGLGTGGFDIFPGLIEVNGKYCRLNSRIHYSGANNITIVNSSSDAVWALTVGEAPILTASDFRIERYTATTVVIYNLQKNGYYTTESRRAICTFMCDVTETGNDKYLNDEYFQQPSIGHRYKLTPSEAVHIGFNSNAAAAYNDSNSSVYVFTSACNGWSTAYQIFDMNDSRYFFDVFGMCGSATGTLLVIKPPIIAKGFGVVGPSSGPQHHWMLDVQNYFAVSFGVESYGAGSKGAGKVFNINRTPLIDSIFNSNGVSLYQPDSNLKSASFFIRVKRRPDSLRRQT